MLTVAVPLAVFTGTLFAIYSAMTRSFDRFHVLLIVASAAVMLAAVLLAAAGASMTWCLVVLALTPWVTVVGYETVGHRHEADVLARL